VSAADSPAGARPSKICFDLDGTLCTNTGGAYESAQPFPWAIARVNALAQAGHRILIMTARGSTTGIDWRPETERQLAEWGVRYDELHFGKPGADVFVDDRALHTDAWRYGNVLGPPRPELLAHDDDTREELNAALAAPPRRDWVREVGRTFGGRPFRLSEHAERLVRRALAAGLPLAEDAGAVERAVRAALDAEPSGDRDLVWVAGAYGVPHAAFLDAVPTDFAAGLTVVCRWVDEVAAGLDAFSAGDGSVHARTVPSGGERGWPLTVADGGRITDALGGDVLVVDGGRLLLPADRSPAVARTVEMARALGIESADADVTVERLGSAEEALIVGMPFCVLRIATLDGRELGSASVAERLAQAWRTPDRDPG
jgi:branched-subunit amino acid aminotransferase/4-amino-4-deoxychorismate lyase